MSALTVIHSGIASAYWGNDMTDDLVKRLRAEAKAFTNHEKLLTPIQKEAADRIERTQPLAVMCQKMTRCAT
jgi:hypothetical protein